MRTLEDIGHDLRTQDNRATSHPIFVVEQKRRIYGVSEDYTDTFELVGSDGDVYESHGEAAGNGVVVERIGYVERWEFVTACFTQNGAEEYLALNEHNLNEPRIYVYSAYGNQEWQTVRAALMKEGGE